MADYLLLLETGDKILQEIGESIGLDGIGYVILQKSLQYVIADISTKKTKTLKYCIRTPPSILTKGLIYKTTSFLLLETGDFLLQENGDKIIIEYSTTEKKFTRSLKYCVSIPNISLTLNLTYCVSVSHWDDTTKLHTSWDDDSLPTTVWEEQPVP